MAKHSQAEEFDRMVDQLLSGQKPEATVDWQPLLAIAEPLTKLPRPDFKRSLGGSLMQAAAVKPSPMRGVRHGFSTLTPYIVVDQAVELAEFMKQVFGAQEQYRGTGSAGGFHIETSIGGSMLMIGGGKAAVTPMPAALHVYVENTDAVYQRALSAGATVLRPPSNQPYGDRDASIRDPYGNHWYIGTHLGENYRPAGVHTVTPCLHPQGTPQVIEWLKLAIGAEELARHEAGGTIRHARLRVGTSTLELGEAHAEFQPMPARFYVYVADADTSFTRALQAGGKMIFPVADQPYGDRSGGLLDPFGNHWYISTHLET